MGLRGLGFVCEEYAKDYRVRRFWKLGLAAVFVHIVVDPLVTYVSVVIFEVGVEANPWLATYLYTGDWAFLTIHLPLVLFVGAVFVGFTWLFSISSGQETKQLYFLSLLAWGGILLWGLLLVGNNLVVLLKGI